MASEVPGPHEHRKLFGWPASLPDTSPPPISRQVELGVWARTPLLSSGLSAPTSRGHPLSAPNATVSLITHSTDEKTEAREADLGLELHAGTRATEATVTAPSAERQEVPGETDPAHPSAAPGRSAQHSGDLSRRDSIMSGQLNMSASCTRGTSPLHARGETGRDRAPAASRQPLRDESRLGGPPASGLLGEDGVSLCGQVFQGPCHVGRGSTVPTACH